MRHKVKHIHFVGIAGAGMSGIAEVLLTLGYQVSGSDIVQNFAARRLSQLGAKIYQGHAASHLGDADVVVVSSAIDVDNPEVNMARERAIPVVPRAEMLSELMRLKRGIAVAGTHGKTTTTSLITTLLAAGGLDPTYVIGGQLRLMTPAEAAGTSGFLSGSHARLGQGDFLVAEADESDASFLHLSPVISVVTNIDQDHMETYGHDPARLQQTFIDFIHRLPFYGVAVMCTDDAGGGEFFPRLSKQVVRYGLNADAQIRAEDIHTDGLATTFVLVWANGTSKRQPVRLNLVGEHNVRNALAAFAVGLEVGIAPQTMIEAMANFRGVERRFQVFDPVPLGKNGSGAITVVDDYGHHPAEISATLQAARLAFPGRRLVLAFQPHRYTRTRDCFEEFIAVLAKVDELFLTEVYAAGEKPIVGSDSKSLLFALRLAGQTSVHFVANVDKLPDEMLNSLQDQDVALVMGAGSIGQIVPRLIPHAHLLAS